MKSIAFNTEMIRALLAGNKTQTRRMIEADYALIVERDDGTMWPWGEDLVDGGDYWYPCPYGPIGSLIWVQEAAGEQVRNLGGTRHKRLVYRADDPDAVFCYDCNGKPGRPVSWGKAKALPRWASRLTLEITGVRVERLRDISGEDAVAEGFPYKNPSEFSSGRDIAAGYGNAQAWFQKTWQTIYPGDWDKNPYVWVIEFKVHQKNIDQLIKQREAQA